MRPRVKADSLPSLLTSPTSDRFVASSILTSTVTHTRAGAAAGRPHARLARPEVGPKTAGGGSAPQTRKRGPQTQWPYTVTTGPEGPTSSRSTHGAGTRRPSPVPPAEGSAPAPGRAGGGGPRRFGGPGRGRGATGRRRVRRKTKSFT